MLRGAAWCLDTVGCAVSDEGEKGSMCYYNGYRVETIGVTNQTNMRQWQREICETKGEEQQHINDEGDPPPLLVASHAVTNKTTRKRERKRKTEKFSIFLILLQHSNIRVDQRSFV